MTCDISVLLVTACLVFASQCSRASNAVYWMYYLCTEKLVSKDDPKRKYIMKKRVGSGWIIFYLFQNIMFFLCLCELNLWISAAVCIVLCLLISDCELCYTLGQFEPHRARICQQPTAVGLCSKVLSVSTDACCLLLFGQSDKVDWVWGSVTRSIGVSRYSFFSARCNIYISRLCYDVSVHLSVNLSVTEVHWHIIANLGFKFQSHFTAHCGRRSTAAMLLAGGSSRTMLASARSLVPEKMLFSGCLPVFVLHWMLWHCLATGRVSSSM